MDDLLSAAVRNNAEWCALVCRTHGVESRFGERAWRALGPTPPYYPDSITLSPDAAPADLLPAQSIKDSFATLDLTADGFAPLFEATWIHRPPAPAGGKAARRVSSVGDLREEHAAFVRAALLDDPGVAVLTLDQGGSILNRVGGVLGVSNLFAVDGGDVGAVWSATIRAAADLFPGLDLVGYEHGGDLPPALAAGFTELGPLRVWGTTGID
jgi:hypothetical protein